MAHKISSPSFTSKICSHVGWLEQFFSSPAVTAYLTLERGLVNFLSFRNVLRLVNCLIFESWNFYFLSLKDLPSSLDKFNLEEITMQHEKRMVSQERDVRKIL